jgi:hypothetical protein
MGHRRFVHFVVAVALGLGFLGCSEHPDPKPTASTHERKDANRSEENGVRSDERWWRDEAVVAELGLTDQQVEAVRDLMSVNRGDGLQHRQMERQLSLRYLRALSQEPYDAALVDGLSDRLVELLANEHRRRIESVRALRDILTQEQWTRLWEVAPRAVQVGRFRIAFGPKISVTGEPEASPTPMP